MQAIEKIPEHLLEFVVEQDYARYTAIDQAGWRYIMRVSRDFFKDHAHPIYEQGLPKTGITIETIPKIAEMDEKLKGLGWRAVAVSGFIPPAVFLEFQALGILPIACDMRPLEHLHYTPAPDIVHEAAGHAPIVADPGYRKYLREYGEIARRAIFSKEDLDVYNAVRHLSEIKEDPDATEKQINDAYEDLKKASASITFDSEATWLARMAWWTTEYGLIGDEKNHQIYGAGLLSSVGESYDCFQGKAKIVPFSIDCVKQSYDITKPQPQLFVTPDFEKLSFVLKELEEKMAYRLGGLKALERAQKARTTTTTVLDSGIQISGTLKEYLTDSKGQIAYLQFEGPTQLSSQDQQLTGQGADYHHHGFGTPVGKIKKQTDDRIEFESGVVVEGSLLKTIQKPNSKETAVRVFTNCKVTWGDKVLFKPEWGTFDMACGLDVISVFGGAADRAQYLKDTGGYGQPKRYPKSNVTNSNRELIPLYQRVFEIRNTSVLDEGNKRALYQIHDQLKEKFEGDWLLRLDILETLVRHKLESDRIQELRQELHRIGKTNLTLGTLVTRGLALI